MAAFNLAATHENLVSTALTEKIEDIKNALAVGKSVDDSNVVVNLGEYKHLGDISKTQAFQQFRQEILRTNPEIKDVRVTKTSGYYSEKSAAVFWLKEPTLARRIG